MAMRLRALLVILLFLAIACEGHRRRRRRHRRYAPSCPKKYKCLCRPQWEQYKYYDRYNRLKRYGVTCYRTFNLIKTWQGAKAYCESFGGYLAQVTSSQYEYYWKYFSSRSYIGTRYSEFWQGCRCKRKYKGCKYARSSKYLSDFSITWDYDGDDGKDDDRQCVTLRYRYRKKKRYTKWYPRRCGTDRRPFICEMPAVRCRYKDPFICNDYKKCIRKSQKCDGVRQCADGSDELNCGYLNCGGTLTAETGMIQSPFYPKRYPNNLNCVWIIKASDDAYKIELQLQTDYKIEPKRCSYRRSLLYRYYRSRLYCPKKYDYLYISKCGESYCPATISGTYTVGKPIRFTSIGTKLVIKFRTDRSYGTRGFKAIWKTVKPKGCNDVSVDSTSTPQPIMSFNFPGEYLPSSGCSWFLTGVDELVITLQITALDLGDGDSLVVYDGKDTSATVIARFGKGDGPDYVMSTFKYMYIEFVSDDVGVATGFKAFHWQGCDVTLSNRCGSLHSPGNRYALNYPNSISCSWNVTSSQPMTMRFTSFYTEKKYDSVEVYYGPNKDSLSGRVTKLVTYHSTNGYYVLFSSDGANNYPGWGALYSVGCNPLPRTRTLIISTSDTAVGTVVTFSCKDGYELEAGAPTSTVCQHCGVWSAQIPTCTPTLCPAPVAPPNGFIVFVGVSFPYKTKLRVSCNDNYMLNGSPFITCQENGRWSPMPVCGEISCPVPPPVEDGKYYFDSRKVGDNVTLVCDDGYETVGRSHSVCISPGKWFPDLPTECRIIKCPSAPDVIQGFVRPYKNSYEYGNAVRVMCFHGYTYSGFSRLECGEDGWKFSSNGKLLKNPVVCQDMNECASNSNICGLKHLCVNTEGSYRCSCADGYSNFNQTHCIDVDECSEGLHNCISTDYCHNTPGNFKCSCPDGMIMLPNMTCIYITCPTSIPCDNCVLTYKNGRIIPKSMAYINCDRGFDLEGPRTIRCQLNGTWNNPNPSCIRARCPPFVTSFIPMTITYSDDQYYKSVASFTCNNGYIREGVSQATCEFYYDQERDVAIYKWSAPLPSCRGLKCPKLHDIPHGSVTYTDLSYLSVATYACSEQFELVGDKKRVCTINETWSGSEPTCQSRGCPVLQAPKYGKIIIGKNGFALNSRVGFMCTAPGFEISDPSPLKCIKDEPITPTMAPVPNVFVKMIFTYTSDTKISATCLWKYAVNIITKTNPNQNKLIETIINHVFKPNCGDLQLQHAYTVQRISEKSFFFIWTVNTDMDEKFAKCVGTVMTMLTTQVIVFIESGIEQDNFNYPPQGACPRLSAKKNVVFMNGTGDSRVTVPPPFTPSTLLMTTTEAPTTMLMTTTAAPTTTLKSPTTCRLSLNVTWSNSSVVGEYCDKEYLQSFLGTLDQFKGSLDSLLAGSCVGVDYQFQSIFYTSTHPVHSTFFAVLSSMNMDTLITCSVAIRTIVVPQLQSQLVQLNGKAGCPVLSGATYNIAEMTDGCSLLMPRAQDDCLNFNSIVMWGSSILNTDCEDCCENPFYPDESCKDSYSKWISGALPSILKSYETVACGGFTYTVLFKVDVPDANTGRNVSSRVTVIVDGVVKAACEQLLVGNVKRALSVQLSRTPPHCQSLALKSIGDVSQRKGACLASLCSSKVVAAAHKLCNATNSLAASTCFEKRDRSCYYQQVLKNMGSLTEYSVEGFKKACCDLTKNSACLNNELSHCKSRIARTPVTCSVTRATCDDPLKKCNLTELESSSPSYSFVFKICNLPGLLTASKCLSECSNSTEVFSKLKAFRDRYCIAKPKCHLMSVWTSCFAEIRLVDVQYHVALLDYLYNANHSAPVKLTSCSESSLAVLANCSQYFLSGCDEQPYSYEYTYALKYFVTLRKKCIDKCPVCTLQYDPVCASDGKTYSNECFMRVEVCRSQVNLTVRHKGECQQHTTTEAPVACPTCLPLYKPVCASDGKTYNNTCLVLSAACDTRTKITVVANGSCADVKPFYWRNVTVTYYADQAINTACYNGYLSTLHNHFSSLQSSITNRAILGDCVDANPALKLGNIVLGLDNKTIVVSGRFGFSSRTCLSTAEQVLTEGLQQFSNLQATGCPPASGSLSLDTEVSTECPSGFVYEADKCSVANQRAKREVSDLLVTTVTTPAEILPPKWNATPPYCKDVEPPRFTNCPKGTILVGEPPDGSDVSFTLPTLRVTDNSGKLPNISYAPEWISPQRPILLSSNLTRVTVTVKAVDGSGNTALCLIRVLFADVNPPKIQCPTELSVQLVGSNMTRARAYFPKIEVHDLHGIQNVTYDPPNGTEVNLIEITKVTVTAYDTNGLKSVCVFGHQLQPETCPIQLLDTPKNGTRACTASVQGQSGSAFVCTVTCPTWYVFLVPPPEFICKSGFSWFPHNIVPDCAPLVVSWYVVHTVTILDVCPGESRTAEQYEAQYQNELLRTFNGTCADLKVVYGVTSSARISNSKVVIDTDIVLRSKEVLELFVPLFYKVQCLQTSLNALIQKGVTLCTGGDAATPNITSENYACEKGHGLHTYNLMEYCVACPAGSYSLNNKCNKCPPSQYQPFEKQSSCQRCPELTIGFGNGNKYNTSCQAVCTPGHYSSNQVEPCNSCPVGNYSSRHASQSCTPCPDGYSTQEVASTSQAECYKICLPGTFSATDGLAVNGPCTPCARGAFQEDPRSTSCNRCSPGLDTEHEGSANSSDCRPAQMFNPCSSQPCHNGTCRLISAAGGFYCDCYPDYEGVFCESKVDDCVGVSCSSHGNCVDGIQNYTCQCEPGYTGVDCEVDVDDCDPNPCKYGSCVDQLQNYTCECNYGFEGRNCDKEIDFCLDKPCQNNGTCRTFFAGYICQCPVGYTDKNCDVNIDDCVGNNNPCENGGTCHDLLNAYRCDCAEGFKGDNCSVKIDQCATQPCLNNGTCVDKISNFTCQCLAGYTGRTCEENINECENNPCENNGTCIDGVNSYECQCIPGFEGPNCARNIDDCKVDGVPVCHVNNTLKCVDGLNRYTCKCRLGFTGKRCETNIDDCDPNQCMNNATCIDKVNNFHCICDTSLDYRGRYCNETIDDCARARCKNNATCVDKVRSFECICPPGFKGDDCSENIDDCSPYPCSNNGSCTDLVDDYECVCPQGWKGKNCTLDVNECHPVETSPCLNNGSCVNTPGSYECECQPGYKGRHCEDVILHCESSPCQNNASCTNLINDYNCTCPLGFEGKNCSVNIDDCVDAVCLNNGSCVDGIATSYCECPKLYEGEQCDKVKNDDFIIKFPVGQPDSASFVRMTQFCHFTLLMWVRVYQNEGFFFSLSSNPPDVNSGVYLALGGKYLVTGSNLREHVNTTINDIFWHHVAVTYNGTVLSILIDGRLVKESSLSGMHCSLSLSYLTIGLYPGAATKFYGEITEVNMLSTVLTLQQIVTLSTLTSDQGNSSVCSQKVANPDLVLWEEFDEQSLVGGAEIEEPSTLCSTKCPPGFRGPRCDEEIDTQKPVFTFCPNDTTIFNNSRVVTLTYEEPIATDNVGIVSSTASQHIGDVVPHGEHVIDWRVCDAEDNCEICSFKVTISAETCSEPPPPAHGALAYVELDSTGGQAYCHGACLSGYKALTALKPFYVCDSTGTWNFIDYHNFNHLPACSAMYHPALMIKLQASGIGTCTESSQSALKAQFSKTLSDLNKQISFCTGCDIESGIKITCSESKRRRRSTGQDEVTSSVQFEYQVPKNQSNVTSSSDILQTVLNDAKNYSSDNITFDTKSVSGNTEASCDEGEAVDESGNSCVACPAGTYFYRNETTNATSCENCALNFYNDQEKQTECQPCPDNKITTSEGTVNASDCFKKCPAGHYFDATSDGCDQCPFGLYQEESGELSCDSCDEGQTTASTGSTSPDNCTDCPLGHRLNSSMQCEPCRVGFYRSSENETACQACDLGTTTASEGSTSSDDCNIHLNCSSITISGGIVNPELIGSTTYPHGSQVTFSCTNGKLNGNKTSFCQAGVWTNSPPTCERFTCPPLANNGNVTINMSDEHYAGSIATYSLKCPANQEVSGDLTRKCVLSNNVQLAENTYVWEGTEPICREIVSTTELPTATMEPTMAETEGSTATMKPTMAETEGSTATMKPTVAETEGSTVTMKPTVAETEGSTATMKPTVAETEGSTVTMKPTVAETEGSTATMKPTMAETEGSTATMKPTVAETEGSTATMKLTVAETEGSTATMKPTVAETEGSTATMKPTMAETEGSTATMKPTMAETEGSTATMKPTMAETEGSTATMKPTMAETEGSTATMKPTMAETEGSTATMKPSTPTTIVTRPPFTGPPDKRVRGKLKILSWIYSGKLADKTSIEYRNRAKEVKSLLNEAFRSLGAFLAVQILSFGPGSVTVDYLAVAKPEQTLTPSQLDGALNNALNSTGGTTKLGNQQIDPAYTDFKSASTQTGLPTLDYCDEGLNDCSGYAICLSKSNGYTCSCKRGYTGDGVKCDLVQSDPMLPIIVTGCVAGVLLLTILMAALLCNIKRKSQRKHSRRHSDRHFAEPPAYLNPGYYDHINLDAPFRQPTYQSLKKPSAMRDSLMSNPSPRM